MRPPGSSVEATGPSPNGSGRLWLLRFRMTGEAYASREQSALACSGDRHLAMCGIGGVVRFDGRSPEPAGVRAMVEALRHRGPDDQGMHVEGPVGLAHTRLSVIDLSPAAHQPMRLDEPPLWIVYNGETYNHRDLRRELETRGHRFRSSSDTEVILRAYVEWGEACVTRLNGMFAFAIWNPAEQRLFLARDRLGIKPLFYLVDPDSRELVFGSEIKTILAYCRHAPALDATALDAYLAFGFVPLLRTPFTGLSKLPPAHTLSACRGTIEKARVDAPIAL